MTTDERLDELLDREYQFDVSSKDQAEAIMEAIALVERLFEDLPEASPRLTRKRNLFLARAFRAVSPYAE